VSRRARAAGFAAAAAVCAGLAAAATGGRSPDLATQLGPLREVVVTREALPARRPISRRSARRTLELRRVPERFLPPGALTTPAQAVGRRPVAPLPPGSYVLASSLAAGDPHERPIPRLDAGRRPVEIQVTAAAPLAGTPSGSRLVDVVVTTEPGPGSGPGRTYVAAEAVALLELRPASDVDADDPLAGATDVWLATLALTREQALRLIHAQSFARDLRLIER
jgi:Flp pilus assembly protein CpaB